MSSKKPKSISASSFRSLLHCPHALYLDHHGDPSQRTELSEFEEYLLDEGRRFEQEVLEGEAFAQPEYPEGDLDAGARATRRLMKAGEKQIYQGVLKSGRYVGVPDLLVKRRGQSELGGWYYEPREIKISSSVHEYHVLQVCFYAMLLEKIQGRRPETATVILADESTETVDLVEEWPLFEERLAKAEAVIDTQTATDLAVFSSCGECVWQDFCHREAVTRNDVTLVADLRRSTKPALAGAGIITVDDLARAESDRLSDLRGIGTKTAERLVLQAQAQAEERVIPVGTAKLPKAPVELYYDIEGEPALDVDYLHGLLVVERGKEPRYVCFIAEQPKDEGEAFGQFVAELAGFLAQHPKVPIYHYHWYERTHVAKLFERYPEQAVEKDVLLNRFVDLHAMLKAAFVLPIEGYGLKPVSKWLGFKYRNTRSSATQSMLWYRLWLETGDRQFLNDSVTYNEDDCHATRLVKDWVAGRRK